METLLNWPSERDDNLLIWSEDHSYGKTCHIGNDVWISANAPAFSRLYDIYYWLEDVINQLKTIQLN
jgi:hypothetical protein